MSNFIEIRPPLSEAYLSELKSGDNLLISGEIFTGRDAAHKRLVELLDNDKPLPFNIDGQIIYYVGPSPTKPGDIIGSAGPTTSYRMDAYTVPLLEKGLKAMIGKGSRSSEVREALKKHKAVYLGATGGAAALIKKCVVKMEIIAYPELGPEAIRKLTVERFPVVVINDIYGNDLYELGRKEFEIQG